MQRGGAQGCSKEVIRLGNILDTRILTCASPGGPHQTEEAAPPDISTTKEHSGKISKLVSKVPRMPEISRKGNILESTDDTHRWARLYDGMNREIHCYSKEEAAPKSSKASRGPLQRNPSSGLWCDLTDDGIGNSRTKLANYNHRSCQKFSQGKARIWVCPKIAQVHLKGKR